MNPTIDAPKDSVLGASQDPFETAAVMFGLYSDQLERRVKVLDPKQLRILILGLLTQPLNEQDVSMEPNIKLAYTELKALVVNRSARLDELSDKLMNLSTGELRRLVNAIVQYPLTDSEFIDKSSMQTLRDAFAIGSRLMEAKTLMFIKMLSDYETSLMENQAQTLAPETDSKQTEQEKPKEENNV